jgi:hypothetical protein
MGKVLGFIITFIVGFLIGYFSDDIFPDNWA